MLIVLRSHPAHPGCLPPEQEGLWIKPPPAGPPLAEGAAGAVGEPVLVGGLPLTETREDGVTAQVYYVRPV